MVLIFENCSLAAHIYFKKISLSAYFANKAAGNIHGHINLLNYHQIKLQQKWISIYISCATFIPKCALHENR